MGGKHWKFEDDAFLASYFDAVGDYIGEHDLGRAKGAATRRVAHLKETGAWDALMRQMSGENRAAIASLRAEIDYAKALGFEVNESGCSDDEAECPAAIYDGSYPWRSNPYGEDPDEFEDELLNEALAALHFIRQRVSDCEIPGGRGVKSRLHSLISSVLVRARAG